MIRTVELSLAFSKKIHGELLLLILSDAITGSIIKMGIVERMVLDYASVPYDTIVSGDPYSRPTYSYPSSYVIHDNYLVFLCRDYDETDENIDKYKARINWIDNDITIGAYKNSIIHSKEKRGEEVHLLVAYLIYTVT